MELTDYINSLPADLRDDFASRCGTSIGYLRKAASVGQALGAEICVAIEKESGGKVTRKDLRKTDWQRIWPELKQKAAA